MSTRYATSRFRDDRDAELDDGIVVEELPLAPTGDVFGGVMDVLRRQAYDAGHARASNELLAALALLAEEFIRDDPERRASARPTLHAFNDYVHRRMQNLSAVESSFDGGLGI